ncbi:PEP-CTERM sorting domain-containing protein [Nitrosomonas sp.]|uniref:PEP-CTERM sorting domain-containing protein n=1 Tax=Nitrosomonas sp. TaxID=42353 RepID=UPI0025E3D4CB|nr:PEP-CTERM sorting domain-containing protein [Nitrosomonas sp.]
MEFELKRNCLAKIAVIALCGTFVTAHAAPIVITDDLGTVATVADPDHFPSATSLGLSFMGREFFDHGSWSFNGGTSSILNNMVFSLHKNNDPTDSIIVMVTSADSDGWKFVETVSIPVHGHVAVQIQLTNNTGFEAIDSQWRVGFNPNQGLPVGLGPDTHNIISGTGNGASVSATSLDGWSVTLANTTAPSAFGIMSYIDPVPFPFTCCALGDYVNSDSSIGLVYNLGTIPSHHSVTFGYEYIMGAVPEPGTYAMLLVGLCLIGFIAGRRKEAAL